MYYILTFSNTHNAIKTKKILNDHISIRTIPVLREISASCGIALRIDDKDLKTLSAILKKENIDNYKLYEVDDNSVIELK